MKKAKFNSIPHPDNEAWQAIKALLWPHVTGLDIGPGIRPQSLMEPLRQYYIEPNQDYFDELMDHGLDAFNGTAIDLLPGFWSVGLITMLDVIEHMERTEGLEVIEIAKSKADQIVIYTPNGFVEQNTGDLDKWGYPGSTWQDHLSGWTPGDFEGWEIIEDGGAFFAVWDRDNG